MKTSLKITIGEILVNVYEFQLYYKAMIMPWDYLFVIMLKRVKILDFIISGCILYIKISRTVFFLLSLPIILISSSSLFQSFIIYGKNEFLKYPVYSANLKKKKGFWFRDHSLSFNLVVSFVWGFCKTLCHATLSTMVKQADT